MQLKIHDMIKYMLHKITIFTINIERVEMLFSLMKIFYFYFLHILHLSISFHEAFFVIHTVRQVNIS